MPPDEPSTDEVSMEVASARKNFNRFDNASQAFDDKPSVLLIAGTDRQPTESLKAILHQHADLCVVEDLLQLHNKVGRPFQAAFCAWHCVYGTWKDAIAILRQRQPNLPVIIFCRIVEEGQWLKVLGGGGFDLISSPFLKSEILDSLNRAITFQRRLGKGSAGNQLPPVAAVERRQGRERRRGERRRMAIGHYGAERRIANRRYLFDRRIANSVRTK